jgi:hypothetical protein
MTDNKTEKRKKKQTSEKQLAQCRKNAARPEQQAKARAGSTGPRTQAGKDRCKLNGWKHGRYATTFINKLTKPCKSTCPSYPCNFVDDGDTSAGQECLDKQYFVTAYEAILRAVTTKKYDEFNQIGAVEIAKNMEILRQLQESIIDKGVVVVGDKIDKEGTVIGNELRAHPALFVLPKLIKELGFTPTEFMITPKELQRAGTEREGIKSIADLMSSLGKNKVVDEDDDEDL